MTLLTLLSSARRALWVLTLLVPLAYAAENLPARGATQDSVRTQHGSPAEVIPPVGEPPISRWIYPEFTVVFEYDRVVHAYDRDFGIEARNTGSSYTAPLLSLPQEKEAPTEPIEPTEPNSLPATMIEDEGLEVFESEPLESDIPVE